MKEEREESKETEQQDGYELPVGARMLDAMNRALFPLLYPTWECHGIDREPTDTSCPECLAEAARELTCRWCGEETEPEESRCCARASCEAAERSDMRGER